MARGSILAFVLSALAGYWLSAGSGQEPEPPVAPPAAAGRTVTVRGVGEVPARIERMVLRARIVQSSEIAEDALQELVAMRAKAIEQLLAGSVPNLVVRTAGPNVAYGSAEVRRTHMDGFVIINGQLVPQGGEQEAGTSFADEVVLEVYGLEPFDGDLIASTAARLIDAVRGAGLEPVAVGEELVELGLVDTEDAERAAYGAALEDGRRRATLVAGLAGLELGPVRSIAVEDLAARWHRMNQENVARAELAVVYEIR